MVYYTYACSYLATCTVFLVQLVEDWNIDAESYDWTKLDPDSEEDRAEINKFLLWEGDFGGRVVADGKVFK